MMTTPDLISPEYIMIGGFLGAGKTTAILRLAEYLSARGRRVGVITNDQSQGLVDTSLVHAKGYPLEEVTGGCFCCRFTSLTDAAERLTRDARPDVFLAEPVGSCTDLRATVQYPLRTLYGDNYRVAPLSVLVDPIRAARVFGLIPGPTFSAKVHYVYEKQLEEAELLVVNKLELIDEMQRTALSEALQQRYPKAELLFVSARTGEGLDTWFERITASSAATPAPLEPTIEVDYDTYAEGEALLGWMNATCRVSSAMRFDGNAWLAKLGSVIHARLLAAGIEIAHFKMTLTPESGADLAVLNLVRSDGRRESVFQLAEELKAGELIVNLRAEADPELLRAIVGTALDDAARNAGLDLEIVHSEHFRPGRPEPTHRVVVP